MKPKHQHFEEEQLAFLTDEKLVEPPDQCARLAVGGGRYIADFISAQEEDALLASIYKEKWIGELKRRVQHYGYRYDYTKRDLSNDDRIGNLPAWTTELCNKLVYEEVFSKAPDQLIINEYEPGQGITPHTDSPVFGGVIASLSLGSDCMMEIDTGTEKFSIVLKQRSLLVLAGDCRDSWKHGIAIRKTDTQNNIKIKRDRRVSLTFRTVL